MILLIYRITRYPKLQNERIDYKMKIIDTDFTKPQNTYLIYKRMFDFENGTDYAKQHVEKYVKHVERAEQQTNDVEIVTYNDGKQRNVVGDLSDNEILIKKCFNHLNAFKRSQSLLQQTNDEYAKLLHENLMYRERDALELSLRTLQSNIKNNK